MTRPLAEREEEQEQSPDEQPEPAAMPMEEPPPDAEPQTEEEAPKPESPEDMTRDVGESIPAADGSRPAEPESPGEDSAGSDLARIARERDEYLELAQRTKADFENFRKRVARESSDAERRGVVRLAESLLPAIDNLERALAASGESSELADGIRMVHGDLLGALGNAGIEGFAPEGESFDPAEHEAVTTAPAEGAEPGRIVEVLQKGYRLDGRVLRAARVVVAK